MLLCSLCGKTYDLYVSSYYDLYVYSYYDLYVYSN